MNIQPIVEGDGGVNAVPVLSGDSKRWSCKDEVAARSGIDKAQLSRLENGKVHDPRSSTLSRYARAVGKRLAWSLEDMPSG